ncbi:MAG: hypothetical protein JWO47_1036 [Candidatus Saccharibacteria bacterium]|nr:hypothetical protein [Candidatus Saccharibacteria bacterium]
MIITTEEDGLCVILHGREQLWALRAKLQINRDDILNISFVGMFDDWRKWEVRMPGASIPGRLLAGSYWTEEGWDFVYVVNPRGFVKPKADNVLVIETDQTRYKRIILSYDTAEAKRIVAWWKKK